MSYYQLLPDPQMNFTLNRMLTQGDEAAKLDEVTKITPQIKDLESWFKAWHALAQIAELEGRHFHAAYYYRMAEFFLKDESPEKNATYHKCIQCFEKAFIHEPIERFKIPYADTWLPAMRIASAQQKAIILVHGGYDSFIEEFYLTIKNHFRNKGYTIILFEGPGQGQALKNGLKFTEQWEKPVKAVLDYFKIDQAVLLGISWGGYLAPRAAAFEPRIKQVIAYDCLYDGLDFMTNMMPSPVKQMFRLLVRINAKGIVNSIIARVRKKKLIIDWAISHGMYITGTSSPFDFFKSLSRHTMQCIAPRITQDVLLLAGAKDHFVPLEHFHKMIRSLVNIRSLSARLFTEQEGGEQHCQVGNLHLALVEISTWLDKIYA